MNILGIGALELTLILVIGLMLVGPVEMVRWARKIGELVRQFKNSDLWQLIQGSRRTMDKVGRELLGGSVDGIASIHRELSNIDITPGTNLETVQGFRELKGGLFEDMGGKSNGSSEQGSSNLAPAEQPVEQEPGL